MRTQSYPSDVTDERWVLIEPHIPVSPGGRPRVTDMRDVVDAIFSVPRAGCRWRYLPKDSPPRSTVWKYFDEWRHDGTLDTIHDRFRKKVRTREKPYSPRTTASVDHQSVDTTSGGDERGRDNAKNVDGRKRHVVVDSMGLLPAVLVTAASADDARAAQELFPRLKGQPVGRVVRMPCLDREGVVLFALDLEVEPLAFMPDKPSAFRLPEPRADALSCHCPNTPALPFRTPEGIHGNYPWHFAISGFVANKEVGSSTPLRST